MLLLLRLYLGQISDFWIDEIYTEKMVADGRFDDYLAYPNSVLYPFVLKAVAHSPEQIIFVGRVISLISWAFMTLVLLRVVTQKEMNWLLVVFSSALLPGFFVFSGLARSYLLSCFFISLSIYLLSKKSEVSNWKLAFAFGGAFFSHYMSAPIILVIFFSYLRSKRISVKKGLKILLTLLIMWSPFVVILIGQFFHKIDVATGARHSLQSFISFIFEPIREPFWVTAFHVLGYGGILFLKFSRKIVWAKMFFLSCALYFLINLIFSHYFYPRYLIFSLPLLVLTLADGSIKLREMALTLILLGMSLFQAHQHALYRTGTKEIAQIINQQARNRDLVVCVDSLDGAVMPKLLGSGIEFITDESPLYDIGIDLLEDEKVVKDLGEIIKESSQYDRLWVVHPHHTDLDIHWPEKKITQRFHIDGGGQGIRILDLYSTP